MFGEVGILDTGELVQAPWLQPGLYFGSTFVSTPDVVRLPDACTHSDGHRWASVHAQNGGQVWAVRDDGLLVLCTTAGYAIRTIIRSFNGQVHVAYASDSNAWQWVDVTTGVALPVKNGVIADGSGGNGMLTWQPNGGDPVPNTPLDSVLLGVNVREQRPVGACILAEALFDPGQIVMAEGGALGSILTPVDRWTLRTSPNGQFYAGVRYDGEVVVSGTVPAVLPPFVKDVMPDVGLVTPARKDFILGSFVFDNTPLPEPNPHRHFGSVIIPIRLKTPWDGGRVINAGQDDGARVAVYAGEDGSQTCEEAITKQRPQADAWGVGLAVYMDSAGPVRASILALMRPGDVFMPLWRDPHHLPAPDLGYPLCPAVEIQRLSSADAATLIIAASKASISLLGAIVFATDRSDCPNAAVQPYLDHWNSTVTTPADWPTKEPPMPTLPKTGYLILPNSNIATINPATPTVVEWAHDPQAYGAYQQVEIADVSSVTGQKGDVTARFLSANALLRIDRVIARDITQIKNALAGYPASAPDAVTAWQIHRLNGSTIEITGDSADNTRHGILMACQVVDDKGQPLFR